MTTLARYSKPRRAGDQTSGGLGKLLKATSELTRIELLIRETLQNSWDARREGVRPTYGVRVDRPSSAVRNLLRDHIFTDLPQSLSPIQESLNSPNIHLMEIYDRGTNGLNGPFRAYEEASDGESNNFNSFVFDIGSTSESEVSGGTYGFGKTATFQVSRPHCVVYWSRCLNRDGVLEHRLIASALHKPYAEEGIRFTGAHWWGRVFGDDVEPLRGTEAASIGRALFQTDFAGDETGTSILVLDPEISLEQASGSELEERMPVRSDAHAQDLVRQISDAIAFSAWPKVIPANGHNSPMNIELYHGSQVQEVATAIRFGYSRWANALTRVRAAQGQQSIDLLDDSPPGVIREKTETIRLRPNAALKDSDDDIFGGRTDNVVGHLHLVASVRTTDRSGFEIPRNRLCMMRSVAELVVRYDDVVSFDDDSVQWHAVFKPTPQCDRHFAASEPSTHDSWTPRAAEREVSTYVVSKTLHHIRSKTRAFLAQGKTMERDGERSVRKVALALRSFVPIGSASPGDQFQNTTDSGRSARRRKRVEPETTFDVRSVRRLADGLGQELLVCPTSTNANSLIKAHVTLFARSLDGRMELKYPESTVIWKLGDSGERLGSECVLEAGEEVRIEVRTRVATAVEVVLTGEIA